MVVKAEKQIKKDNLDAQIEVLNIKLEEKRQELDAIARREQAVADDRAAFGKDKAQFFEEMKEHRNQDSLLHSAALHTKGNVDKETEAARLQLAKIEAEVREGERRLVRLNSSCLNAQRELDIILRLTAEAEAKVRELTNLVIHYEEMKLKVKDIEDRRDLLDKNLSNERESYRLELIQRKEELDSLTRQTEIQVAKAKSAEDTYDMYSKRLQTSMNDWLVMRTRLEVRFKEHYPELQLPME